MNKQHETGLRQFTNTPQKTLFDERQIPAELYETDPEAARTRILEGLQIEQEALQRMLTEQGVLPALIEEIRIDTEQYALEAMRADQLIAEHPEYTDVALSAYSDTQERYSNSSTSLKNGAKSSISRKAPDAYERIGEIGNNITAYGVIVTESVAVKQARLQDLRDMMSNRTYPPFPNLRRAIQA